MNYGKRYNRLKEEADRLGFSPRTLQRKCKDEGFPYIRTGGVLLFDPELSDQYLAGRAYKGRAAELAKRAA